MMFDIELFLGIPLDQAFEKKLKTPLFEYYTKGGLYLEKRSEKNGLFLGKTLAKEVGIQELLQLEANVKSLLAKIIPAQELCNPYLIPLPKDSFRNSP